MTQEEINQIASVLRSERKEDKEKEKWIDWLFKATVGLILYFGLEVKKDVTVIKEDTSSLRQTVMLQQQTVNQLQAQSSKPIFTEADYINRTQPLINSINKNTLMLDELQGDVHLVEERLLELEFLNEAYSGKQRRNRGNNKN